MRDTAITLKKPARAKPPAEAPNPVDVHIGKRLKFRRMMIGLSQEDVAGAVGVAFQQIQKYECAVNRISTARLWDLSAVLQCPVAFFYEGLNGAPSDDTVDHSGEDMSARQETLKLVRAYYGIRHAETRRHVFELAASLSRVNS